MRRRWLTALVLLGLAAVACGKYGPPMRVHRQPEPAEAAQAPETDEEDSDQEEQQP